MTRLLIVSTIVLVATALLVAQDPELPDGDGKRILVAACTSCHDLKEVTKLRGFYTKEQWKDVVNTMVEYGADLKKGEDEVLVDYLTQHLGKK
jgi:hypothetical protein